MLEWLRANLASLLIAALLLAAVAFAVVRMIRNRKKGSSCGCGCSDCPMHGSCRKK